MEPRRGSISVPELREVGGERRLLTGGGRGAEAADGRWRLRLVFASRVVLSEVTAATHRPGWMPATCGVERQFTDLTACLC